MDEEFIFLIAEDCLEEIMLIKRALRRANIRNPVYFVTDGKQAMDYLHGVGIYAERNLYPLPNLAIFDIKMPRQTGLDALEEVRKNKKLKLLPVIIMSSSCEPADVTRAYELHANAFLLKKASFDEFIALLRKTNDFWTVVVYPAKD